MLQNSDGLDQDPISLDEEVDDISLALIYPTGDGKDQKSKGIQAGSHFRIIAAMILIGFYL